MTIPPEIYTQLPQLVSVPAITGARGPQGPQGEPGDAAPGARTTERVDLDWAGLELPAGGTYVNLPWPASPSDAWNVEATRLRAVRGGIFHVISRLQIPGAQNAPTSWIWIYEPIPNSYLAPSAFVAGNHHISAAFSIYLQSGGALQLQARNETGAAVTAVIGRTIVSFDGEPPL